MNAIIFAAVSVTVIGAVCAVILCAASKIMAVKVDERLARIEESLPGTNCGACGYPGCSGYAAALVSDSGVKTNLCAPGGAEAVKKISEILGVDAGEVVKTAAVVRCRGSDKMKMEYMGIESCVAAKQLFGGAGECALGCLGYGDCRAACPSDAVCMVNGLARISAEACTGCALCVKACPNKLITVEDASLAAVVVCKSIEKGAAARKKCANACLGCGKCVRECPEAAIAVVNNLAVIDYEKCTNCGHCVEVCVAKCIRAAV